MTRVTVNLFNWKLRAEIRKRRGRAGIPQFIPTLEELAGVRVGSKISRFFRYILENANIKSVLGKNLAVFVAITSAVSPAAGVLANIEPEVTTLALADQPISTEIAIQYPTDPAVITQGYHLFHFGIDLDGVTGDPVRPIMEGFVIKEEFSRFSYGNSILLDHQNGLQSLYAHLSKIDVNQGDKVDTRTVIGEMGATGRAFGDHLHLEVYRDGQPVNPRSVLPPQ